VRCITQPAEQLVARCTSLRIDRRTDEHPRPHASRQAHSEFGDDLTAHRVRDERRTTESGSVQPPGKCGGKTSNAERGARPLTRVVDRALAGSLPEEFARSLVRHRVLERIAAELAASGELERLLTAALGSPRTLQLTDRVLGSDETQSALRHVASSPELRDAIALQTTGLAEEVVRGVRAPPCGSTIGPSRSSAAPLEANARSTAGSRRAHSRSRPTQP
jgi:hypothetical protein